MQNLQRKKKRKIFRINYKKKKKKEAGRDAKHVSFFTWPQSSKNCFGLVNTTCQLALWSKGTKGATYMYLFIMLKFLVIGIPFAKNG